jgi:AraC-like DNA-binding protein
MYVDFINRVRQHRARPERSRAVNLVLDYIDLHTGDRLDAATLAAYAGYTPYYLTRKFKEETGEALSDYVKRAKVERAKHLLATTADPVQAIADQLGFCSRSHFAQVFRQFAGASPTEYRQSHGGGGTG